VQDVAPTRWNPPSARAVRWIASLALSLALGCSSEQPIVPTIEAGSDLDGAPGVLADGRTLRDGAMPLCAPPDAAETEVGSCSVPRRIGTPYGCIDRHCSVEGGTSIAIPVSTTLCSKPSGDAGASAEGGEPSWIFESDDDECKFHVQLATTCESASDLSVTFALTKLIDGTPASGAAPYVDAYLSITHFAPSAGVTADVAPGVYSISHIQLDASGAWTLEFHLYASCPLGTSSPHAHFTTFFEVP
jgi:hypothetical protein